MNSTTVPCPHCSAMNETGAAFCGSCGKALPMANTGPRVVSAEQLPASAAAAKLVGDDLQKKTKKAANTLLVVGIIQWVVGSLFALLAVSNAGGFARLPAFTIARVFVPIIIVGAAFIGLYFWARVAPLPATIVGMVIYCTLIAINVVTSLANAAQGHGTGFGGLGIGWLDIVIVVFLAQGISAAMQYRKLVAAQAAGAVG